MGGNLFAANRQWATRPDDERFETLEQMLAVTRGYALSAQTVEAPAASLRVEANGEDLYLTRGHGGAKLTHYAFGQIAARASAPANYLRSLPPTLAAQNINHGLKENYQASDDQARILMHQNGSTVVRAVNGEVYDRTWNYTIVERLMQLRPQGWRVPPARPVREGQKGTRKATEADILPNQTDFGLAVKVGDDIAPAGLYASDHDMFAFLVNPERAVKAGNRMLMRGIIVRNSEVGDGAYSVLYFCMDEVCGNHIIWGVENVHEIRVRHVAGRKNLDQGRTMERAMAKFRLQLARYEAAGAAEQEIKIQRAMEFEIGATKEEIIDATFKYAQTHSLPLMTRSRLEAGLETAEKHEDWYGNPRSAWGLMSGITENSQAEYTDARTDIDVQAARLLNMAF
jgi:hypothetical protein